MSGYPRETPATTEDVSAYSLIVDIIFGIRRVDDSVHHL